MAHILASSDSAACREWLSSLDTGVYYTAIVEQTEFNMRIRIHVGLGLPVLGESTSLSHTAH